MAKTDGVRDGIYLPHNNPSKFFNNATVNEVSLVERIYMRRFREMCINRFVWEGLPDSIDPRFLESVLFEQALAVYCRPEDFNPIMPDGTQLVVGDMALRATPTGYNDYQDNPLQFTVLANNMYSGTLDVTECVPIWANTARQPDIDIVMWYSKRLAEAERTIDLNLKAARHTRVAASTEEARLSTQNMMRQIDAGEPVLFTNEHMDTSTLSTIDWNIDYHILGEVPTAKNQIMNDCMTMLGINNANQDKTERLVSGEADARSEQVGANRAIALNERERACEKINKMFGTSISVRWNEELNKDLDATGEETENGNVYDGATGSDETDR